MWPGEITGLIYSEQLEYMNSFYEIDGSWQGDEEEAIAEKYE